jgi:HEAT repeat protein
MRNVLKSNQIKRFLWESLGEGGSHEKEEQTSMNLRKKPKKIISKPFPRVKAKVPAKGTPSTVEASIAGLASHDDGLRVKARHALVALGKAAVPPLIEALKNKSSFMRWEAAKALGEIGDPEAAPALVDALEDEAFEVRWLAAEGLIKMNINGLKPLLRALEHRGDSVLLLEGAHHVFHDLTKGALRKYLVPVLAALEALEPGRGVPWAAPHEMNVEVPLAARQALEILEKGEKP